MKDVMKTRVRIELTIEQVQEILGWSYPTTLRFAKKHGRQDKSDYRQRWLVPIEFVENEVNKRVLRAGRSQALLYQLTNNR